MPIIVRTIATGRPACNYIVTPLHHSLSQQSTIFLTSPLRITSNPPLKASLSASALPVANTRPLLAGLSLSYFSVKKSTSLMVGLASGSGSDLRRRSTHSRCGTVSKSRPASLRAGRRSCVQWNSLLFWTLQTAELLLLPGCVLLLLSGLRAAPDNSTTALAMRSTGIQEGVCGRVSQYFMDAGEENG